MASSQASGRVSMRVHRKTAAALRRIASARIPQKNALDGWEKESFLGSASKSIVVTGASLDYMAAAARQDPRRRGVHVAGDLSPPPQRLATVPSTGASQHQNAARADVPGEPNVPLLVADHKRRLEIEAELAR